MQLPLGRARAFEAARKQGFVWGWEAGNKGSVSAADRAYMKAPIPRPLSQTSGHRDYMCGNTHPFLRAFFLKIEMGGKAILGLFRLDYLSAKTGKTVNGGAESAVHLDR